MSTQAHKLLQLLRGTPTESAGLSIIEVVNDNPPQYKFEGTDVALDASLFEVPQEFQPVQIADRFFALPIATSDNVRWGLLQKIN